MQQEGARRCVLASQVSGPFFMRQFEVHRASSSSSALTTFNPGAANHKDRISPNSGAANADGHLKPWTTSTKVALLVGCHAFVAPDLARTGMAEESRPTDGSPSPQPDRSLLQCDGSETRCLPPSHISDTKVQHLSTCRTRFVSTHGISREDVPQ